MDTMKNVNHLKKMALLNYKDTILKLHAEGKSIREITKIVSTRMKISYRVNVSKSTIHKFIKRYSDE